MAKSILMEEFHIAFTMRAGMPVARYAAVARTLRNTRFQKRLRAAITTVLRPFPSLQHVKIKISC